MTPRIVIECCGTHRMIVLKSGPFGIPVSIWGGRGISYSLENKSKIQMKHIKSIDSVRTHI
jgi:hypothetical protein